MIIFCCIFPLSPLYCLYRPPPGLSTKERRMLVRTKYWSFYYKISYQSYYYKRFSILFTKVNQVFTIFCGLVSLSSVAAWGIWKTYPVLWSLLICVSQVTQAILPKLSYNDLLCPTKFMISSLGKLCTAIDHSWLEIDVYNYTDEQILELIEKYENQYAELVSQFFDGTFLPEINYCVRKAEKECAEYFRVKYSL